MLNNKVQTKKHVKKMTAILLSVLVLAMGCMISASAAAERWSWTVNVSAGGSGSASINAVHRGTRSDTMGSYITIYNGKAYTKGTASVQVGSQTVASKQYIFYGNEPTHPTINFGTVAAGASLHHYKNTYGGFKSSVDTYQYY